MSTRDRAHPLVLGEGYGATRVCVRPRGTLDEAIPFTRGSRKGHCSVTRFQPSEGVFLYLLGLVIVATHPGRFWFGFALAALPLLIGPLARAFGGRAWSDA